MKKFLSLSAIALSLLVAVNFVSSFLYTRFDMTEDSRYTLSPAAVETAHRFEKPVVIDVLLDGELPQEFVKLKTETDQLLQAFAAENQNIKFAFIDPLEGTEDKNRSLAELQGLGLTPAQVTVEDNGKVSQELVFPWAMVNYGDKTVKVPLLKNKLGASTGERVNNSVQNLEYAFADAFSKLSIKNKKHVAVIKGNGELEDIYLADFLTSIREYYNIGAITLDSVAENPQKTLNQLNGYDLALIAKPTEAFTDTEKYVLDQYILQGGKSLWLVDPVVMELDSLFNTEGKAMALPRNLNLQDFFFKYGIRLNKDLINDLYFTQIVLATGEGNASQYDPVPWYYHPMVFSSNDHPINNNIEALRFQFASSIDILSSPLKKEVLLRSSPLSRTDAVPRQIALDEIGAAPDKDKYSNGNHPLAVLLEGNFPSAFANRVKPIELENPLETGENSKMLVIADGDLIKNQVRNGRPLELGYDKWTNNFFGNKDFLINAVNYMLDDGGLINIRSKKVAVPYLDEKKIADQKSKWQLVNIGVPLVSVLVFGLGFNYLRKRKYGA